MTAPTPVPNPHVKDGISYGHLFASYTEGTADTSLDLDPYPDERFLTGTVLLRPRFSGQQATAVLRVPGTPRSRGLVITEQEYKVVQSRLVDRQDREGVWLMIAVGDIPIHWQATVVLRDVNNRVVLQTAYALSDDSWLSELDGTRYTNLPDLIPNPALITPSELAAINSAHTAMERSLRVAAELEEVRPDIVAAGGRAAEAIEAAEAAEREANRAAGLAAAQDEVVAEHVVTDGRQTRTAVDERILAVGNATYEPQDVAPYKYEVVDAKTRPFAKSVPPGLTAYPAQRRPHHKVMFQSGGVLYAIAQHGQYAILKSADFGQSWSRRGSLPSGASTLIRVKATGTLLAVDATNFTSVSNPAIRRSTDDGANWTVAQSIRFPCLSHNGIVEAMDGSLLVAEYGNVAGEVYRVYRSTDDGQTWTAVLASPGGDPAADPGHIHSVSVDPYSGNVIAFMDRAQPELWTSTDHGATWTKTGTSTDVRHPNWVQPMFFPEHIVWATDNQANGRICRIKYADFYAGNFNAAEVISLVNRKANYYVFPLRRDVWMFTQSTEVIAAGNEPSGPGSFYSEAYIVTDEGATVSASLEQVVPESVVGTLEGRRPILPGFHHSAVTTDSEAGRTWLSLNRLSASSIAAFDALPVTSGYAAPKVSVAPTPQVPSGARQWYASWWYGPDARMAGTNSGLADGRMVLVPVWVPHAAKFDKIAAEVTTTHQTATFRIVAYSSDAFDRPHTRIYMSDPQPAAAVGVVELFTPATELRPGLYWLGVVPSGGAIGFRNIGNAHVPGMPSTAFAPGSTGPLNEPNGFYVDGAQTPPTQLSTYSPFTSSPKVMVRAAV